MIFIAFCRNCGNEVRNEAVICMKCGCYLINSGNTSNLVVDDSPASAWEILLSVLFPIAGIILGCVFYSSKPVMAKSCLKAAIITSIVSFVLIFLFYLILFALVIAN